MLSARFLSSVPAVVLAACAVIVPAHAADTIDWATWTSATPGNASPGSATGTIPGGITVTYSGQNSGLLTNYPSWNPTSTFTGGVVGNAPPAANGSVQVEGGYAYTETLTFSTAVADPIFAVWSLGETTVPASFDFSAGEPFTVQGGGPSAEYGGTALYILGEDVEGQEGNGIIQFNGTFSTISFTTPQYENFYAFTVGEDQTLTSQLPGGGTGTAAPEIDPASTMSGLTLLLGGLAIMRGRFRRMSPNSAHGWLRA
jgi:hypothetical protein